MKKIYTQLVKDIASETNNEEKNVRKIMDNFISQIKRLNGYPDGKLYLKGLGKFYVVKKQPKQCKLKNFKNKIPAMYVVTFKRTSEDLRWEA